MQNKKQLIDHIQEVLRDYDEHGGIGFGEEVYRIALEKLTAPEPVPVAWCHENGPFGKVATCSEKVAARWAECNDFKVTPFYAAPVVLADVLPGEIVMGVTKGVRHGIIDGAVKNPLRCDGWNAYRAELLRRINLIESGQWKIVPTKPTDDMEYAIDPLGEFSATNVQSRYDDLLAVAPEFK